MSRRFEQCRIRFKDFSSSINPAADDNSTPVIRTMDYGSTPYPDAACPVNTGRANHGACFCRRQGKEAS
jgi:hypothetical protein